MAIAKNITFEGNKYYLGNKTLSFVGFSVPHPHIPNGIIRMAFENITDDNNLVSQYLINLFALNDHIDKNKESDNVKKSGIVKIK